MAVTTTTEEPVRRAIAIRLIINRERGLATSENPCPGNVLIEELADPMEQAVQQKFETISSRGGVPGAMESGYQRGRIREGRCTTR